MAFFLSAVITFNLASFLLKHDLLLGFKHFLRILKSIEWEMLLRNREISVMCNEHVCVWERGGQCTEKRMRRQGQRSFWPCLSLRANADGKTAGGEVVVATVVFVVCVLRKTMFYKA